MGIGIIVDDFAASTATARCLRDRGDGRRRTAVRVMTGLQHHHTASTQPTKDNSLCAIGRAAQKAHPSLSTLILQPGAAADAKEQPREEL